MVDRGFWYGGSLGATVKGWVDWGNEKFVEIVEGKGKGKR